MAAEVIANDLRSNLYRIDLSSVVSKYIGETKKISAASSMPPTMAEPSSSSTKQTRCSASAVK